MIDFLINDIAISHNSSFEMKEDIRWVSPREFKRGWAGQMIYQNAYAMNHLDVDLVLDGWVTSPILSSLPPGSVVTIAPITPISYLADAQFELSFGTEAREVEFYNPTKTTSSSILLEVIEGVAALPWEHNKHYNSLGMEKPEAQYRYYLKYIKFLAIVTSNTSSTSRNGTSQKISFSSVNPICALRPNQPI